MYGEPQDDTTAVEAVEETSAPEETTDAEAAPASDAAGE